MNKIIWLLKYSVDNKVLDDQHKELLNIMNDFMEMSSMPDTKKEEILPIVTKLENYINVHFNTEESFMKSYAFPDYENHMKLHNEFKIRVSSLKEKCAGENPPQAIEMLRFLYEWLVNHIEKEDQLYVSYINEK